MRIALIADIHGNLHALEAVIGDLARREIDTVVNLGDHASGPLLPAETVKLLRQQDWVHLAGNHERQLVTLEPSAMNASDRHAAACLGESELTWMAQQQSSMTLSPEVLLCHGTPSSETEYFLETVTASGVRAATASEVSHRLGASDAQLIACAHTHIPRSVRTAKGQLIVNPGSVGLPAYDDVNPFPHVMASGSPDARYGIVEKRAEGWISELISVPYDSTAMADLARQRGRDDWATALLTGYLTS